MKKVISFCLYGTNARYNVGAVANAILARTWYPDWTPRFYLPTGAPCDEAHRRILELFNDIEIVPVDDKEIPPMFTRMLVADDPDVERFIVRDCDSRLDEREAAAVQEWVDSSKPFHVMRDHPAHSGLPVPGGMWGAVKGALPNMRLTIKEWVKKHHAQFFNYGLDQDFLAEVIWDKVVNNACQHSSVAVTDYPGILPFPMKRKGHRFIGEVIEADGTPRAADWEAITPDS